MKVLESRERYHLSDALVRLLFCFGIMRNHPFNDGNLQTEFVAGVLFLELNGYTFNAKEMEPVEVILAVASGEMNEDQVAEWFRLNISTK